MEEGGGVAEKAPSRLKKDRSVDILDVQPSLYSAIWSWMYIKKVSEDHRPIFLMSSRSAPANLRAIAPPARRECDPTRDGVMSLLCKPNSRTAALMACRMSLSVT